MVDGYRLCRVEKLHTCFYFTEHVRCKWLYSNTIALLLPAFVLPKSKAQSGRVACHWRLFVVAINSFGACFGAVVSRAPCFYVISSCARV